MSLQISPWSTHQRHFKIDSKKKFTRLSPLRRSRHKKQHISQPLIEAQELIRQEQIIFRQISERPASQQHQKQETQDPISLQQRRGKQRLYLKMQETLVLRFIKERLEQQVALAFMLPSIRRRQMEDPQPKVKKKPAAHNRTRIEVSITPILSSRKKKERKGDNSSRLAMVNYSPFDDSKIIEKGLKLLKNRGYKLRDNAGSVSLKIKGL